MLPILKRNVIKFSDVDVIYDKFGDNIIGDDDYGFTSTIFDYKNNQLLKVFVEPMDYRTLQILKYINKLDTKTVAKIIKYLKINKEYYGYIVTKKPGRNLLTLPDNTKIRDLLKSMKTVEKDIRLISSHNIFTYDLKPANLLYDMETNISSIIDEDCYYMTNETSTENITLQNLSCLYLTIFESISKSFNINNINDELYNYIIDIILQQTTFDLPIDKFYDYIIELIEGYTNKEITTINDMKKALICK